MYRFGVVCMLLVVLNAAGRGGPSLAEENKRLGETNRALTEMLRQLVTDTFYPQVGVESKVGQYDWQGYGCFNEIKKSCKGDRRFNLNWFNRETQDKPYSGRATGDGWCQRQCEYFAVDGCCQYDMDTNDCWFVFDGVVQDDDYYKRYYSSVLGQGPSTYDYVYQRYAGMCKWKGNKKMVDYNRQSGCDWNGDDKVGQKQMSGSNISDFDCTAFCFDDPECNFAQVKDGQCRTFQQCHSDNNLAKYGYTMWQKIDTYIYDY